MQCLGAFYATSSHDPYPLVVGLGVFFGIPSVFGYCFSILLATIGGVNFGGKHGDWVGKRNIGERDVVELSGELCKRLQYKRSN